MQAVDRQLHNRQVVGAFDDSPGVQQGVLAQKAEGGGSHFLSGGQIGVLEGFAVVGQIVLQVNGDQPDGAGGAGGFGVLIAADDFAQFIQRGALEPGGQADAVVEPMTGGGDFLGKEFAFPVNDCLGDLGVFAVGGQVGGGGGKGCAGPGAAVAVDQLDRENPFVGVKPAAKLGAGVAGAGFVNA